MRILTIKDKKDLKILRKKTSAIKSETINKAKFKKLIDDMTETMLKADGIGLAANQIGLGIKLFVAEVPNDKGGKNKFYAIFNPEITRQSKETSEMEEGCLSVPETYGAVKRPEKITMTGYNINGKKLKIKAWGLTAKIFQHEIDNLNGKLFIDAAKNIHKIEENKKE